MKMSKALSRLRLIHMFMEVPAQKNLAVTEAKPLHNFKGQWRKE